MHLIYSVFHENYEIYKYNVKIRHNSCYIDIKNIYVMGGNLQLIFHNNHAGANLVLIEGQFSIPFVIISIVFAIVGAYAAFVMHDRAHDNSFFPKSLWFFLASFALGFGIWAMHYMGMFAFELPRKIRFDPLLTAVSIIPVLIAAYVAFYLSFKKKQSLKTGILSSSILGIGVVMMHSIGMLSMISETSHHYHLGVLLLTFLIGFFSFFMFYTVRTHLHKRNIKLVFSILMGISLSLTHYSAMLGMEIYVEENTQIYLEAIPMPYRNIAALVLTSVFIVILIFLLFSGYADKYVQHRAEHYDVLTRLQNTRMFEQALEQKTYTKIAVLNIKDLHKCIEETTYLMRESAIKEIASRIENKKSKYSELYRTDYYQFVLLSNNIDTEFIQSLESIQHELKQPYPYFNSSHTIPPFMCLYMCTITNTKMDVLFEQIKIRSSKLLYSNQLVNYEKLLQEKSFEEEIIELIPNAMEKNELYLVYQPKFHAKSASFNNVEALIRWNHPSKGFVSPGIFIPILERHPLIFDVTDWIIHTVCKQLNMWADKGVQIDVVSINIPGTYVTNERLRQTLVDAVTLYNIRPNQMELEITETSYVDNIEEAIQAVLQFRQLGFLVAIDDFGTGVSSLSYLKMLAVTTLKIDKSFVDGIPNSEKDSEIIKGIISLASSLRLNVVIEGVEHVEQANYLNAHFEDALIQGYFYSKPLPADELESFYEQIQSRREKMITVDI